MTTQYTLQVHARDYFRLRDFAQKFDTFWPQNADGVDFLLLGRQVEDYEAEGKQLLADIAGEPIAREYFTHLTPRPPIEIKVECWDSSKEFKAIFTKKPRTEELCK